MIIKNNNTFHMQGKNISYIMAISKAGDLLHYYFGEKLADKDYSTKLIKRGFGLLCNDENDIFLETEAQEYPAYGYTDLRNPAYTVQNKFGNSVSRLTYKDYSIKENEVSYIEGMPSLFKGDKTAQTLEITLCDEAIGLAVFQEKCTMYIVTTFAKANWRIWTDPSLSITGKVHILTLPKKSLCLWLKKQRRLV